MSQTESDIRWSTLISQTELKATGDLAAMLRKAGNNKLAATRRKRGRQAVKKYGGYSRKQRRALTLAAAKKAVKEFGLPRSALKRVWNDLMKSWPAGTLKGKLEAEE